MNAFINVYHNDEGSLSRNLIDVIAFHSLNQIF